MRLITAAAMCLFTSFVFAHDGTHDDWLKKLKNGNKVICCDGTDAFSVIDPDWDNLGEGGHYRVRQSLNHKWMIVPNESVVKETNQIGVAKVWPTVEASTGLWTSIRCCLPGSGI